MSKAVNKLASRFKPYQTFWVLIFIFAACIIGEAQFSNIDIALADYFFNPQNHTFAWRHTWFAQNLMHGYVKDIIIAVGFCLILVAALDAIAPWQRIQKLTRTRLQFVAIAAVIVPSVIGLFKHFSNLHCPIDLLRYGGDAPYLRLFDALPAGAQAGQCFPAGHASTGLWLAALCVFWLPNNPKKAVLAFIGGISVGLALGWVQQMRGAHFLSHTLTSVWLAGAIILLMLAFFPQLNPKKNPT